MDKLNNSLVGVGNRVGGLVASAREQALQDNNVAMWQSVPWDQIPYYSSLVGSNKMIQSAKEANEMNIQLAKDTMAFNERQAQKQMDFQERMSNTAHQREMADLKAAGLNPILAATNGAVVPSGASAAGVSARVDPTVRSNPYESLVQSTYAVKKFNEIERKQIALSEKYYDVELKKLKMSEIQLDDMLKNSSSAREVNRSNILRNSFLNALSNAQIGHIGKQNEYLLSQIAYLDKQKSYLQGQIDLQPYQQSLVESQTNRNKSESFLYDTILSKLDPYIGGAVDGFLGGVSELNKASQGLSRVQFERAYEDYVKYQINYGLSFNQLPDMDFADWLMKNKSKYKDK